jgi:hypothetical protein
MGLIAGSIKPPRDTQGPFRDVDSAVRYAGPHQDMTILTADASDPTLWRYTLTTTRDETVALDIHFAANPDPALPAEPTRIEARIGRFGDPARERALVREIENRLAAVRATGTAPDPGAD